ncbi:MAG: SEL1-like repeat protein [Phenylobacterium sp.]|uniref:SEL1-like repeat protein n=1 Tax=Phenylobacterium sp. TaxID=1871053 RepID=UPI001A4BD2AD|nr:hypothetical protein [Phenylobacterium sp.]MBL8772303.1 SEL1-like repeat protein [Phenylobacterium sp.]
MSAGAPWSVKGIDPKAREVAKDLARRSGMTLGEWLNRVILEDDIPDEITVESQFGERLSRMAEEPRLRPVPSAPPQPELAGVAAALDRLTDRIEASETRTGLAINGIEHSVRQALARIEASEREQQARSNHLESLLAEAQTHQGSLGERLGRLESEPAGPRSAEALRALETRLARAEPEIVVETVLQRLGERLAAAEAHTTTALEDLTNALAGLDRRLSAVEGGAGHSAAPLDARFEALAQTLTEKVEATRGQVAEMLSTAAGAGIETRFAELTEQVRAAERRSVQAVEDIGRQVLAMAEAVSRKLGDVDAKSAEAIDQVGTEVARIAGAVELRLARQEQTQAEAFERLQAELSKVTKSLSGRPAADAAAQDEDLAAAVEAAPAAPPETEAADPNWTDIVRNLNAGAADPAAAPFGPELLSRAEAEPEHEVVSPPWRRLDLDVPEADIPQEFAPIADDVDEALFESRKETAEANAELSTREVIERARVAARAAKAQPLEMRARVDSASATGRLFQGFGAKPRRPAPNTALQTAMMIAGGAAFLSVGAAGLTLMQGPAPAVEQAKLPETSRAAMARGPASLAATPVDATDRAPPPVFAQVRADVEAGLPGALPQLKALAQTGHAPALLYLAQLYDSGEAGLPRDPVEARRLTILAAEAGDAKAMHNLAVYLFRGEGGPADAVSAARWFRKAAEAGVVESQYNLGLLYQSGSGVPRDLAAARHWFGQAASRGDAEARRALSDLSPRTKPAAKPMASREPAAGGGASLAGGSMNVRQTQGVLARLGYYSGPIDGRASVAYDRALAEYRREQVDGGPIITAAR